MGKYVPGFVLVGGCDGSYGQDAAGRRYSQEELAGHVRDTGERPTPGKPVMRFFKPHIQPNGSAYSDRLRSWNPDLHRACSLAYFHNTGDWWDGRSPEKIEAYLRAYNKLRTLELTKIEHQVNWGNGFPLWYFEYYYDPQELAALQAAEAAKKGGPDHA